MVILTKKGKNVKKTKKMETKISKENGHKWKESIAKTFKDTEESKMLEKE